MMKRETRDRRLYQISLGWPYLDGAGTVPKRTGTYFSLSHFIHLFIYLSNPYLSIWQSNYRRNCREKTEKDSTRIDPAWNTKSKSPSTAANTKTHDQSPKRLSSSQAKLVSEWVKCRRKTSRGVQFEGDIKNESTEWENEEKARMKIIPVREEKSFMRNESQGWIKERTNEWMSTN